MTGRDRLRELLDAVLDEENRSLADMAHGAYSSPFHFSRRLVRDAGEPPVAMRRRVALERAAWQLARGVPVTDAAFAAGYGSVEGFARAFARAYGHPPSASPAAGRRPAARRTGCRRPTASTSTPRTACGSKVRPGRRRVRSPRCWCTTTSTTCARWWSWPRASTPAEYARERLPGLTLLHWAGPEGSIAALLNRCVGTYEIWLASVEGADHPGRLADDADPVALAAPPRRRRTALARVRPRRRASARLGRPAGRRAVRPTRELRARQRARARAHLLRPAPGPRARPAPPGRRPVGEPARAGGPPDPSTDGDPIEWLRRRAP